MVCGILLLLPPKHSKHGLVREARPQPRGQAVSRTPPPDQGKKWGREFDDPDTPMLDLSNVFVGNPDGGR